MKVLFTVLVMLYLVLDFGDPNLAGAMTFDPEDAVEVVQPQRAPSALPRTLAVMPEPLVRLPIRRPSFHARRCVTQRFPPAPPHLTRHVLPDASASEEG